LIRDEPCDPIRRWVSKSLLGRTFSARANAMMFHYKECRQVISKRVRDSMMRLSIISGVFAFVLLVRHGHEPEARPCTELQREDHPPWGIISIVLVQIVLWTLAGFSRPGSFHTSRAFSLRDGDSRSRPSAPRSCNGLPY